MKKHTCYKGALLIGVLSLNTLSSCVHTRQTLGMNSGLAVSNNNVVPANSLGTLQLNQDSSGITNGFSSNMDSIKTQSILNDLQVGEQQWGSNEGEKDIAKREVPALNDLQVGEQQWGSNEGEKDIAKREVPALNDLQMGEQQWDRANRVRSAIYKADVDSVEEMQSKGEINWNYQDMVGNTLVHTIAHQLQEVCSYLMIKGSQAYQECPDPKTAENVVKIGGIACADNTSADPSIPNIWGMTVLSQLKNWILHAEGNSRFKSLCEKLYLGLDRCNQVNKNKALAKENEELKSTNEILEEKLQECENRNSNSR
ncbi:hypothetical protein [Cardinium endosymbiont of Philonthus spinipes]|uniref:hypothetical protein n=1 Tax=Cardinium endosymbiont of Philonthus spinipes TaxID=3077941 RepID=UPI00313C03AB